MEELKKALGELFKSIWEATKSLIKEMCEILKDIPGLVERLTADVKGIEEGVEVNE